MQISPWERAREVYNCEHRNREYRFKILSNGARAIYNQCVLCGDKGPMVKKDLVPVDVIESMSEVDEGIIKTHSEKINNYANALNDALKSLEKQDRKEKYYEYLESPEWKHKRLKVLNRDRHVCQCCLEKTATIVHHLTYAHIYNEPLFELVSVCAECHEKIHNED